MYKIVDAPSPRNGAKLLFSGNKFTYIPAKKFGYAYDQAPEPEKRGGDVSALLSQGPS